MRILVAPQELKGSLSAEEAAEAIAAGVGLGFPGAVVDKLPLSDGGPGFIDAMRRAVRADTIGVVVHDALGRPVLGRFLVLRERGEAVVEAAQANGLMHLGPDELDAVNADSYGVGELIQAALGEGVHRVVVGVGGSATSDGGAGMARALGARFRDMAGNEPPPGGGALARLERIDWAPPAAAAGVEFVVATDVTNPLLGKEGAAAVYGPQKGATPGQVDELEEGLVRFGQVVRASLGVDVTRLPGGGAAGGLGAGLVAFLGAKVVSGFDVVAEATGLVGRVAQADIVATGEGSFDAQSLQGKATGRLLALAAEAGKRTVVFAGRASVVAGETEVRLLGRDGEEAAESMRDARGRLQRAAEEWAATLRPA